MDLQKRQDLQKALEVAMPRNGEIGIECTDGRLIIAACDLVCYENHVEVTDKGGALISLPYDDIERVTVAPDSVG